MKVLIACEFSGVVRDAFAANGHDAWSCDLLPTESPGNHYQRDITDVLDRSTWDLIIAHPPCTAMAVSGNSTYAGTQARIDAEQWTVALFRFCQQCAPKVCFENPVSSLSRVMPMKAQYIQPWQFGHPETKKTGLYLWNLPPLVETNNVYDEMMALPPKERHRNHWMSPGPNRGKERSRFYPGIAKAMVDQWG